MSRCLIEEAVVAGPGLRLAVAHLSHPSQMARTQPQCPPAPPQALTDKEKEKYNKQAEKDKER